MTPRGTWGEPGPRNPLGSAAAGVSGEDGSPNEETPGGAGGAAGGAASVSFWTEATEHISIECFGYFDGSATFRADREELNAEQLELLTSQRGVVGRLVFRSSRSFGPAINQMTFR